MRRALVPLLVLFALLAGITLGGHPGMLPGPIRDFFVGDGDTRVVREALEKVHDTYYREVPEDKLADAAVKGIVDSLGDRFSNYFTPKEYRRFRDVSNSQYEGVGMQVVVVPDGLRVVETYDGSPARRAGIEPGDVIVAVNGSSLAGKAARTGSDRIKGPPGTPVKLSVRTDGKTRELTVNRARVSVPILASRLRTVDGKKLGVVRLATFTKAGAHGEVRAALQKLIDKGAEAFVLDLRGNGGGLVSEAQLVASQFLDGGTVVSTRGRSVAEQTLEAQGEPIVPKAPLVVLVDHDTASASEIVAGALQDRKRAEVVGVPTFGKGVFQEILELSNGGALDITAGQYFTPSGRNLGGKGVKTGSGIEPDIRVKDDPETKPDEALDRALDVLSAQTQ